MLPKQTKSTDTGLGESDDPVLFCSFIAEASPAVIFVVWLGYCDRVESEELVVPNLGKPLGILVLPSRVFVSLSILLSIGTIKGHPARKSSVYKSRRL